MIWDLLLHDEEAETLPVTPDNQSYPQTTNSKFINIQTIHNSILTYLYFIYPNISYISSIPSLCYRHRHSCTVKCRGKKKCQKRNFIIVRNISHLPSYLPPPWQRPPPPVTKKDEKLLSAFCELSGKYLSWEQGVIMLSERSKKKKVKKKKRGEGEIMTKASHCSSSSTLELVVHRLACAGGGWGCPALGPAWKQIFQVSARQKWMRTLSQLSIVNMNEACLPKQPENPPALFFLFIYFYQKKE